MIVAAAGGARPTRQQVAIMCGHGQKPLQVRCGLRNAKFSETWGANDDASIVVGFDPDTIDFSHPVLPPGMSAEKIRVGIALALRQMKDRGWEGDFCSIRPDETAGPTVERHLASAAYDCVVIGAGVRLPPKGLALLEAVVNAAHRAAPAATIAFNTRPDDSADAAARLLSPAA